MELVLYQINPERDYEDSEFKHFEYAQKHGIEPEIYDRVWSGHLEADDLSEAYMILNGEIFPDDYLGRYMAQSDVCEVIGTNGESKFFYVDDITEFKQIEFDASQTREARERVLTVLACYPGKTAEVIKIPNTLEAKQKFVDGFIEAAYPSRDPIAVIVNEEGKINGLPLNRALYNDDGEMVDVVCGNMMVVGLTEDDFGSLRGELLEKYTEKFKHPEKFVLMGDRILAFKIPEQKQTEDRTQKQHRGR